MYRKKVLILYNRWLILQDALNPDPISKSFMCMLSFKQSSVGPVLCESGDMEIKTKSMEAMIPQEGNNYLEILSKL